MLITTQFEELSCQDQGIFCIQTVEDGKNPASVASILLCRVSCRNFCSW